MLNASTLTMAAAIALVSVTAGAQAAPLTVMASGAMSHALQEISADFARKNGQMLDFVAGTTGVLQDKVRGGEKTDIIEVTSVGMDALEKEKLVVPGTRVELARALIGVAVREGAPVPDISTPEAVKARLISARSVAWIDPKVGGQAGAAITGILKQMGIADEVTKKSVFGKTGADAVQKMAAGDADIAISFVSEIMPIRGAKLVGPLPGRDPKTGHLCRGDRRRKPQSGSRTRAPEGNDHARRRPRDGGRGAGPHRALRNSQGCRSRMLAMSWGEEWVGNANRTQGAVSGCFARLLYNDRRISE